jgi:uncharacterized LabA/DUF88 family protein
VSKNVAVFVDVANIFYAAKAAGVDIDYVTLLRAATAGRDFVRAYAYTGLDPENENQRNFHAFLQRHGYRVVSKDIRKYGDGKVKANLDIELVVDMLKTARNLDIAVLVSGDGDFAPAIKAVQEMGVRVEVISFRGNTSSDLIEVADQFIDITQIAKVEKGSTRSGRRVAATAEEDLSMTEVPEKQTEGTGRGRGRGRRSRAAEEAPAAAAAVAQAPAAEAAAPVAATGRGRRRTATGPVLTLLPGEKLSGRAAAVAVVQPVGEPAAEAAVEPAAEAMGAEAATSAGEVSGEVGGVPPTEGGEGSGRRRRRRRRGGRGRGRARTEGAVEGAALRELGDFESDEEVEPEPLPAPSPARHSTFGSVWDSQIGMPSAPRADLPLADEDLEALEEPEVPEYLLAERRRAQGNRARGGRVSRAYTAAVERERFGRPGSPGGLSRYPEPARPATHGPVGGRAGRPARSERPERRERPGAEPWSEVPPEIEAMLRAQLAAQRRSEPAPSAQAGPAEPISTTSESTDGPAATAAEAPKRRGRRRTAAAEAESATPAAAGSAAPAPEGTEAAPTRRRTTRRRTTAAAAEGESAGSGPTTAEGTTATAASSELGGEAAPPRRRSPRRRTAAAESVASTPEAGTEPGPASAGTETAPTRRRTTRRRTTAAAAEGAEPTPTPPSIEG